ncbi:MAG: HipA domain-containing protein [Thermoleophilaceae bacterium]
MPSEAPSHAFVWVWLPGAADPVVAGRLDARGDLLDFTYGRSYLARDDAIPLYLPELPLVRGRIEPLPELYVPGCIADAAPDAWGQRLIMNRLLGAGSDSTDPATLSLLTYLLESGSDRTGAIDFQRSPGEYVRRGDGGAPLELLAESVELVERGEPLPRELEQALLHGSSIGGARPKATIDDGGRRLIAKFSSTADRFPVVKAEFVAMELARRCGLDVASVELTSANGKDALLVERFDREPGAATRRPLVSALTILELHEMLARYASYADLAEQIRRRFTEPRQTLRELFGRIVFNVLVGNTDDHARNHAAFWDGSREMLTLAPAYDICPQARGGGEASQAMIIRPDGFRMSQVSGCVEGAATYMLSQADAREMVDHQIETIESQWADVCDLAALTRAERHLFWRRQFLNRYALEGHEGATAVTS